ncbi:PEP-CTERM sorting domain-containing protein [Haloferula chungangensis]|uniref:PEP-CTERM sorting domain-containing protein n=1 Tax=Haloferula chungangensis TaxID=1048331 RepID=A0ABW2L961_9BACT
MSSLKFLSQFGLVLLGSSASLQAFTTDFPSSTFGIPDVGIPGADDPPAPIAGVDGWTINDSGADGGNGLTWLSTVDGANAAKLGGNYEAPTAQDVYLTHAVEGFPIEETIFQVDFTIVDSNENFNRDGFGLSLGTSGLGETIGLNFLPVFDAIENVNAYHVEYSVGGVSQGDLVSDYGYAFNIFPSSLYTLNLSFTANGANPSFSGAINGVDALGNPFFLPFSDVEMNGMGGRAVDTVSAVWNVDQTPNAVNGLGGDNLIAFTNLSVVPEPSAMLLGGLSLLGLMRRRRQA